jgi:pyruvate/2-oxoglutarate dehydrogenase complex dihydrolipoamide dehydrogenase (E3) component
MAEAQFFDSIVIGAGPAGEVIAGRLADAGQDVALVECELVGGECSFWACMPSKALLRPAELLAEAGRVPGLPIDGELDVEAILARRDEVVHDFDDAAQLPWIEDRDIKLFRGAGRLDGERRVVVGNDELTAREAVVIATGSIASIPPIDGLSEVEAWSNREVTAAKRAPASLIIIGGGVVGVEMAQAWSTLGTEVSIIEPQDRVLVNEEEFASREIEEALTENGVRIHCDTGVERASRDADGTVVIELENGETLRAEHVLVAAGRKPRVTGIGLETVDIETDGPLEVDDRLRVGGRDWLYAVGDVNGRSLLTHMGKYQARAAAANVLGGDVAVRWDDGPRSPRVIFTDPEIAAVGHTLASALEAEIDAKEVDVSTAGTAGASFHGRDAPGTSRLVVDEARRVVVGATFVGPDANELLHAATIAVVGEVPVTRLRHAVPAFPTRSEVWLNLLQKAS